MVGAVRASRPAAGVSHGRRAVRRAPGLLAHALVTSAAGRRRPLADDLLRTARGIWSAAHRREAPHVGAATDADGDLLDVMSMDASARADPVATRPRTGRAVEPAHASSGSTGRRGRTAEQLVAAAVLPRRGYPGLERAGPIGGVRRHRAAASSSVRLDTAVSEIAALDPNYITWLRTASTRISRPGVSVDPARARSIGCCGTRC